MFILAQDRNIIFPLSDKWPKGLIYAKDIYINGDFVGTNIYGKKLFKSYLLGTYEEDEAEQVVSEIYTLLKASFGFYSMPDPTFSPEDLGMKIE